MFDSAGFEHLDVIGEPEGHAYPRNHPLHETAIVRLWQAQKAMRSYLKDTEGQQVEHTCEERPRGRCEACSLESVRHDMQGGLWAVETVADLLNSQTFAFPESADHHDLPELAAALRADRDDLDAPIIICEDA